MREILQKSWSLGSENGKGLYRNRKYWERGDHRYGKAREAGEMPRAEGHHEAERRYTRGLYNGLAEASFEAIADTATCQTPTWKKGLQGKRNGS